MKNKSRKNRIKGLRRRSYCYYLYILCTFPTKEASERNRMKLFVPLRHMCWTVCCEWVIKLKTTAALKRRRKGALVHPRLQ
jgi:hypothetical protein